MVPKRQSAGFMNPLFSKGCACITVMLHLGCLKIKTVKRPKLSLDAQVAGFQTVLASFAMPVIKPHAILGWG